MLLLCAPFISGAQLDTTRYSKEVSVEVRTPKTESIEKFNNSKHFQYTEEIIDTGLLERLLSWLLQKLFSNMESTSIPDITKKIWNYAIIPMSTLIIIFATLKLLGIKTSAIFGQKPKSTEIKYAVYDEDVNSTELDNLFATALSEGNLRLAVRYMFLKSLKQLNDLQLIKWNPTKTNHSYIDELSADKSLQTAFQKKVQLFDLIWYGEYPIRTNEFEQIHQIFNTFYQQVHQSKRI
jgi:hypothetical protein